MKAFHWLIFPLLLLVGAVSLTCGRPAAAAPENENFNWPQWRGAQGTGISTETGVPLEWGPDRNIRWKTPLPGRGHSSPVVWQNRIFLTTDIQGEVIDGAKAVVHMEEGKEFKHPDAIGADRRHLNHACAECQKGLRPVNPKLGFRRQYAALSSAPSAAPRTRPHSLASA